MIADAVTGVQEALKADVTIASMVSGRVFGAELPRSEAEFMPRRAIVLRVAGGGFAQAASYVPLSQWRIDVLCYGDTPYRARELYRAVSDVLKQRKPGVSATVRVDAAQEITGPLQMRDELTDWPIVVGSWLVTAHDVAVVA